MRATVEKEIIESLHNIDKVVVRMDQKLTDHLKDSVENHNIIHKRINTTNENVQENTKFRNKLGGMGKLGAWIGIIVGGLVAVIAFFNNKN